MINEFEFFCIWFIGIIGFVFIILKVIDTIREPFINKETDRLLSKYYSSLPELCNACEKYIDISYQYYGKIFSTNKIYEKIFVAEILMAYIINAIYLYELQYSKQISDPLSNGLKELLKEKICTIIPIVSAAYVDECYCFRKKQYRIFFKNAMNKLFLTEKDIKKQRNKLFFMTLLNIKIFYYRDINYFENNDKAIPLVNEKVFSKESYESVNIINEQKIFLQMIYLIYNGCMSLFELLASVSDQEESLCKRIRKII